MKQDPRLHGERWLVRPELFDVANALLDHTPLKVKQLLRSLWDEVNEARNREMEIGNPNASPTRTPG